MIDKNHPRLSIARQCQLIDLSRASYYRDTNGDETPDNQKLMNLIDELYMQYPFYGSRKILAHLRRQGYKINRKRVQRLMRKMGLQSIAPKPYTSASNKAHKKYPYLLSEMTINQPNQVWCADITYIRLCKGFAYLVAIMDWHSRHVLSWEVSTSMDDSFCVSALERAIRLHGKPEIFNTDQGVQFTSHAFTDVLKAQDVKISMDGKGRWMDNVFIERLWRSMKYEDTYVKEYQAVHDLRNGLKGYFHFYNNERPHQSLQELTPAEVYYAPNELQEAA